MTCPHCGAAAILIVQQRVTARRHRTRFVCVTARAATWSRHVRVGR